MRQGTFLGGIMRQSREAIDGWERALKPLEFKRIIELGTARGHFSLYLYMWCLVRQAQFFTFDIKRGLELGPVHDALGFGQRFREWDVLKKPEPIIEIIRRPGVSVLFCDNGDKVTEVDLFAPQLKRGDIIAAHDWPVEIGPTDVIRHREILEPLAHSGDKVTKFWRRR